MRKWYKFLVDDSSSGIKRLGIDQDFKEHQSSMGGYKVDDSYGSKETFFKEFLNPNQRFYFYDDFLKKHLKRSDQIFSVASGRCVNELYLGEMGYSIICSDLGVFQAFEETKKMFPHFRFMTFDVLKEPLSSQYDAIVSLSLIYLFDQDQLRTFFNHISRSLKPSGRFILDSAGSSDNLLSSLIHDKLLPFETYLKRLILSVKYRRSLGIIIKEMGFRRTDQEIITAAGQAGFKLCDKENYAFLTEFERSLVLRRLIKYVPFMRRFLLWWGKSIPYVRMFEFQKVNP